MAKGLRHCDEVHRCNYHQDHRRPGRSVDPGIANPILSHRPRKKAKDKVDLLWELAALLVTGTGRPADS